MKLVVLGAHLRREDVEGTAVPIEAGEVVLSAIEVDDDRPLGDRKLLLEAAGVRAALLTRATFIAIRYGFSAASAEAAAAKVAAQAPRWRTLLERHRGRVELTLKVAAAEVRKRPDRADFTSGAAWLRALHEATRTAGVDEGFRTAAETLIVSRAVEARWIPRDERSLELAVLVERSELETLREAAEQLRAMTPHVPFMLSGPWPLEVFADDDHE